MEWFEVDSITVPPPGQACPHVRAALAERAQQTHQALSLAGGIS